MIKERRQMSDAFRTALFIILSGGYQDAYTYCCRGKVFANAQTGNIVLMSVNLFNGDLQKAVRYVIPLLAFLAGIIAAESVHHRFKNIEKIHWRQIVILCEIIMLFAVGFMPQGLNAAANALVSFVCAMQVQTFRKVRGHAYASTMCIGNMKNGAEALCAYFHSGDKRILAKAGVYFGVILLFAVGAGIGGAVTAHIGERAIWVSCALLTVSFCIMFKRERRNEQE